MEKLQPAHCLAAVLLTAPLLGGCMFIEGNIGYYKVSGKQGEAASPKPEPSLEGGMGFGVGIGTYIDLGHNTVRIGGGAGYDVTPVKNGATDGSAGIVPLTLRADVSVLKLSEDTKLRATLAGAGGGGKVKGPSGEIETNLTSIYVGPTYWLGLGENTAFLATAAFRYMKFTPKSPNQEFGPITATGPELRLTLDFDASSSSSGGGGGGGGGSGIVRISVTMDDATNLVPALANGARRAGCEVSEKSDGVIAKCSGGNIVYIQSGRQLDILCQEGLSETECRSLNTRILDAATAR